jgi:hypothetical protein
MIILIVTLITGRKLAMNHEGYLSAKLLLLGLISCLCLILSSFYFPSVYCEGDISDPNGDIF